MRDGLVWLVGLAWVVERKPKDFTQKRLFIVDEKRCLSNGKQTHQAGFVSLVYQGPTLTVQSKFQGNPFKANYKIHKLVTDNNCRMKIKLPQQHNT